MSTTANKLISDAYFASDIVAKEFEEVKGSQVNEGLRWLNQIISELVVNNSMIPYETQSTFTGVIGQEEYSIADLIAIDTLTFVKDSVRYAMSFQPRDAYQGNTRVVNITSLPYKYYCEREFGGAKIFLYFQPDDTYEFTITGVFRLSSISTLSTDLELTLEPFYIAYLQYALADRICAEYASPVPIGVAKTLAKLEKRIAKNSKVLDLTIKKRTTLNKGNRQGWAWVNLGQGWMV